ncbi:hypothetical protein BJ742DRAFT_853049 [Cladochytrium replicatum]|nr:hypothetical protein BJ742DRAFT_853049 [Cladochytrium replicatum]
MDLDENNTAGGSGNKNDTVSKGLLKRGRKKELRRYPVQLGDTTIDALLGTPLAKKRNVKRDDVFVKNYCLKIGIERVIVDVQLIPVIQNDPTGRVPINEIDFGVDDDLDDGDFETVDLFVEVLAQQLDSMLHTTLAGSTTKSSKKTGHSMNNSARYMHFDSSPMTKSSSPTKAKALSISSFRLKSFAIDGKHGLS